jgi:hypothetical protein
MQSLFGALLAAGYAASVATQLAGDPNADQISTSTQAQLQLSYGDAETIAAQYPQYADAITSGAKTAFLAGDQWAYLAGIIAVLIGAALVFLRFPRHAEERDLLAEYHREDTGQASADPITAPTTDHVSDASKGLAHGR